MKTYIGLDAGHNNLKLLAQDEGQDKPSKIMMPSYILLNRDLFRNVDPTTPGLVTYLSGANGALSGVSWLMGEAAIAANERASIPLASVEGGKGKVDYCLHSLLSLLSALPHRESWDITLVCSNHRADVYANIVKERMQGRHEVLLSGQKTTVSVVVSKVVDEATHYAPKSKTGGDTALIDFGGGTTIFIKYDASGRSSDRHVVDVGVDELINFIYDHTLTYSLLHKDRSRHLIRKGIEAYTQGKSKELSQDGKPVIWYGIKDRGGKNISEPYWICLNLWLKTYMKEMLQASRESLRSGANLELIGGGALLPGLETCLLKIFNGREEDHSKGFNKVTPLAVWVNALALLKIALASSVIQEVSEVGVKRDDGGLSLRGVA